MTVLMTMFCVVASSTCRKMNIRAGLDCDNVILNLDKIDPRLGSERRLFLGPRRDQMSSSVITTWMSSSSQIGGRAVPSSNHSDIARAIEVGKTPL